MSLFFLFLVGFHNISSTNKQYGAAVFRPCGSYGVTHKDDTVKRLEA